MIGKGIVNGIVTKLQTVLVNVPVYTEEAEQGAAKPYLLVRLQAVSDEQRLNGRIARMYSFDIQIYSTSYGTAYDWLDQVLESLVFIDTVDGSLYGTNLKAEMKDKVLHIGVEYHIQLKQSVSKPPLMQKLDQTIKQGG